jgi:hypothetical protein
MIEQFSHDIKFEGLTPAVPCTYKSERNEKKIKKILIEDSKQQVAEAQSIEKLACDIKFKGLTPAVTCI